MTGGNGVCSLDCIGFIQELPLKLGKGVKKKKGQEQKLKQIQ